MRCRKVRFAWFWLCLLTLFGGSTFGRGEEKTIYLRNGVIRTAHSQKSALRTEATASGLFLIQFEGQFQAEWRGELKKLGVALVRFVPEDAFIASLEQTGLNELKRLPFVRFVGKYRAELKVHEALARAFGEDPGTSLRLSALVGRASDAALQGLQQSFTKVEEVSRTSIGTILTGQATLLQLKALASSDLVLWIEPAPRMHLSDEISSKIVAGRTIPDASGSRNGLGADGNGGSSSVDSSHQTTMQQLGWDGRGVVVAVVDSGLNNGDVETMHPDLVGRVDGFFYYGSLRDAADQNGHGTHVAGIIAGDAATGETDENGALYGLGIAPRSHLIAQRVFDVNGQDQFPDYEVLTHDAVRSGAVIGSNSWGEDVQGRYDLAAARFDALVRDADAETPGEQPFILEFSAGNAGPGSQTIGSPGVGKNVMAIGASQNDRLDFSLYKDGPDFIADFSSRGPCEDGRIKPDVVAPGTWIASLQSESAGELNAWGHISDNYHFEGGTSQAVPHAAGAAAVFVQYYRETHGGTNPSPALVKAALINSAAPLGSTSLSAPPPNMDQGWGRIALTNLLASASGRTCEFVDQTELLRSGDQFEKRVIVASSAMPLKFTLVYTDFPGLPAALPALVNDLDLEVTSPDGEVYHGNQFLDGESLAGATAFDTINNVEAVHLSRPLPGDYVVRVRARNVVEDVHVRDSGSPRQDFALVISGDLPKKGVGVLVFDRAAYRPPALVKLKLVDDDLAGQDAVRILVRSSSEPAGEWLDLRPSEVRGVFTGSIPLVSGNAAADSQLQVSHGDAIEASYQDASPASNRTATARADLRAPLLTELAATNRFGREVITWKTDEPARAVVYYGTNANFMLSITNQALALEHEIALQKLAGGGRYQYYILLTDEAGNTTRADNGGQFYTFVAQAAPTVLLVNAYVPDDPIAGTKEIPLSSYTGPLDQSGFPYVVWDLTQPDARPPEAEEMNAFRAVIWRLSDSYASKATLSPAEQAALMTYVQSGGSLMIASMELLSRIGPVPFRTNILQVQTLLTNSTHGLSQCPTCDEDHGVEAVLGAEHDLIGDGMDAVLDYSSYDSEVLAAVAIPSNMSDTFGPAANAAPVYFDSASRSVTGIRYPKTGTDTAGRVVFLAFPFDALPETNRVVLMRRILTFLAPDAADSATVALDRSAYSVPDLVTIEITDASKAGQAQVQAKFYTSTASSGSVVLLQETPRRGLFRGAVTLIGANELAGVGRIPARAGDMIWVEYTDSGNGKTLRAEAEIDTSAPQIQGVSAEAAYDQAVVRWSTSERTDALVQFGESTFLGRTAYLAERRTDHVLTLTGLKPDRPYYFRVVSRDNAGNTTVDDNKSAFYSFRTLRPVFAPWVDSLEASGTNWTIQSVPDSESAWTVGPPANGRETAAHSPANAFGSNRDGHPIAFAQTSLLSPPLALLGGNYATLRFWQSYNFASGRSQESGRLLIRTNADAPAVLLEEFQGQTEGWQEAILDLSKYAGRVIQLEWSYSFAAVDEAENRPGWLLDDFSLAVTNLVSGSIVISNNLAEAGFSLTGPISRSGQGWSSTVSHAPPGQYIVQFDEVPFYKTPPAQTNVLRDVQMVLQGIYTFDDVNNNGISDAWEEQYFGSLAASNSGLDSDGDGASNAQEFFAGTDPQGSNSTLLLTSASRLPNGMCRLAWTAVPGHAYQVQDSTDFVDWEPISGWIRASATQLTYTVKILPARSTFFRLEVKP